LTTRIVTGRSAFKAGEAGALFDDLKRRAGEAPKLLVVFASSQCPLGEVMAKASAALPGVASVGCSTAGEFTGDQEGKGQFVAWLIAGDDITAAAGFGARLKESPEGAVGAAIPTLPNDPERPHRTAILLLDPLSGNGEEAALLASTMLGPTVRLAGGAAGDDLGFKQTLVAAGDRVGPDAVAIAMIASRRPLGIGVQHGHKPLSRPLTITKAEGATVYEIDGRPAFEVWKEEVRAAAGKAGVQIDQVPVKDMGGHLLRYEVGLIAGANEYKIRAPLSVGEKGALNFACGIPSGAVVRVTESVEDAQIASARTAAERARKSLGGAEVAGALIFDCICRNLILGSKFGAAVKEIHSALGGAPLAGFETYGEIAMDLGQSSGFHNTTTVVLAFPV
jgi:methyl-accepting chemotaxis protein